MCNCDFSRSIGATESLMRDCHFEQPETLKDEIVFQVRILRDASKASAEDFKKLAQSSRERPVTRTDLDAYAATNNEYLAQIHAAEDAIDGLLLKLTEVGL